MDKNNNLKILIIDDNPEIHRDFIKILTTDKSENSELNKVANEIFGSDYLDKTKFPEFHIDTSSQGQDGVARIAKAVSDNNPYSLAFVDIRMPPGWDGIETIKHIWAVDPDIQIVICTAYSDYSWEETVAELGQRENLLILKKPFDRIAIRQLSCALTKKWQLLKQSREYTNSLEENIKQRTRLLEQSLSVTRGTLESAADGILVVDIKDNIIDFNRKFLEMWDISAEMINNITGSKLLANVAKQIKSPDDFTNFVHESFTQSQALKIGKIETKDRIFEYYSQSYQLNDRVAGRIWSFRDITDNELLMKKIAYQATHDMLTGLPNRALLIDRVQQAISTSERTNSGFSVIFLDLDRFKLINDSFSHSAGDKLLQLVAKRIKETIRSSDTIARVGGDEFIGIITLIKDDESLIIIINKILDIFKKPFKILEHEIIITPSIGISVFPRDGTTLDELLRNADIAMYKAKETGGNQLQFYSADINKNNIERLEMEADIHKALKKKEFILYYQPQIDLTTKKIVSVEALIRWQHPKKGLLLPINFIPVAEDNQLIIPIGEWVLREACKQNKKWQEQGLPKVRVTVNVSSNQFKSPNFVQQVKDILAETKLDSKYLELELTENLLITTAGADQIISELKKLGVYIALDDFGTGYSSLSYLRNVQIDVLKIDNSFVKNINIKSGDEVIIQAIISMAQALKLDVVAEGIETQKQLDFLKSKQCEEGQGFYFSEPVLPEGFEKMLKGNED